MTNNPRQVAFFALRDVYRQNAFAEAALDKWLQKSSLSIQDKRLATELIYGCVRRQRTLDAIIDQLAKKKAEQQPVDIRIILHLGLYQIRFLNHIPESAAVDTTVELTKQNSLAGLAGFVNGFLRQYIRLGKEKDALELPADTVKRLGILYSYPDWIVENWINRLGVEETEKLCKWFNQSPTIDLRVNVLKTSIEEVENALMGAGVAVSRVRHLPEALRLTGGAGAIENLPGYKEGWWSVQDSSAQLVGYLLDPQPNQVIIDACAAPGGKTTHIAELMADTGKIWACDKVSSRLKKVQENADRLELKSIEVLTGDSRNFPQFKNAANRVLLDAPCSGLGTLHRRAEARWRQSPENIMELANLQKELLAEAAEWVKVGGVIVYATCTVHPAENEDVIEDFLGKNPNWEIEKPSLNSPVRGFMSEEGWVKVWPHLYQMDGFFMVRLKRQS
ncbi:16S rRNA (cytosine(967)-C(5))-methyltransferase [Ancylothrix sp. C2]|uniref:16S rRNA (cytosine(967)-C(5))-methyltransferase n=1 Tax=Ancylothrix sp. D3o TaxID=2953691 RepID=UPI0021BAEDD4|nr:16S rRNA (cytosine(967)-C(5))-methyltransferase [Ancylothrix sp. D3o]MCT7952408.1 16S rRNA (cytosine(967)-C(5))-methyltransferase [Ancylothrix sp. D3o]